MSKLSEIMSVKCNLLLPVLCAVCLLLSACSGVETAKTDESTPSRLMGMPLLYEEDFSDLSAEGWNPSDPTAWVIHYDRDRPVYGLMRDCQYEPPVRSPVNFSIYEDLVVSDFVLEVRLRSTTADYGHRDMCLFFGRQDPSHFYYVHFGLHADPHSNSIFLVNGEPRASIADIRTAGTRWSEWYHTVRVVRRVKTGEISVYFDDMTEPVMRAHDSHFTWGRIGVGSFDDTGNIDSVRVWGRKVNP